MRAILDDLGGDAWVKKSLKKLGVARVKTKHKIRYRADAQAKGSTPEEVLAEDSNKLRSASA